VDVKRCQRNDERGATLVILGLVMVALMAMSGLAVDGGRLLADRRQNQNSADASALAGAQAMRNEISDVSGTWTTDQIWSAVQSTAANDGASASNITCYLIDTNYNFIPSNASPKACSAYTSSTPLPSNAYGVYVSTTDTQTTAFMSVVGIKHFTTSALAAAAVEGTTFTPTSGSADLEVCAVGSSDPKSDGSGLTTTSDSKTPNANIPILVPNQSGLAEIINTNAIGQTYDIKGNGVKGLCSTNGSFKGLVCSPGSTCPPDSVPGYWPSEPGNHSGPFRNSLAADCDGTTVGCTFALPLCYAEDEGPAPQNSNDTMYCSTWGSFEVTSTTANSDEAVFTGQAFTQTGGQGGGIPTAGQAAAVRLVE
jgi:Flp pilus assembly protein TadG